MRVKVTNVRVGLPAHEAVLSRHVTLDVSGEESSTPLTLTLDEINARKLYSWLCKCLTDLNCNEVDPNVYDREAKTIPVVPR